MKQVLKPGHPIDFLTPDEMVNILPQARQTTRVRAPATVLLSATGAGDDEVYKVPAGYELEIRRVVLTLTGNIPSDPTVGAVAVGPGATTPANLSAATSGANAAQAPTIPGVANRRITVNQLTLFASAAGSATVTVTDGTTTVNLGTVALTTAPTVLNVGATFAPGATVTVNVGAAGAGVTTTVSATGTYTSTGGGSWVAYTRSGSLIEYAQPQWGAAFQIPGVQTWGDEQGPYLRNEEVFGVIVAGLTANGVLNVYMEGLLTRPGSKHDA